jgi:hypothetical protein
MVSRSVKSAFDFLRLVFNWLSKSAASGSSLAAADFSDFSPDRRASSDFRFSISASWRFNSSNCSDSSSPKSEIFLLAAASREFSSEIS